ncbi:MAG TPA: response regulator transcription factor [Bryobacteraceae bacterium]|nr:response regulator transcription factor [Bryobacteraceae bacterium]
MIRVLVADDHPLLRSGLKHVLSQEPDLLLAGEAEDSEQVLARLAEPGWDVVILDITMPGRGGLECLREIRRLHPEVPVLVLSMHPEEQFAVRAIKSGASGYLNKTNAANEVVSAIRKIVTGKKYVSANLAEMLANALDSDTDRAPHESLSDREFQVMCKIASGKTVSQIAAEITLSVKTVSTYRARVLEKMSMRNNAELTRYAIQRNLVN